MKLGNCFKIFASLAVLSGAAAKLGHAPRKEQVVATRDLQVVPNAVVATVALDDSVMVDKTVTTSAVPQNLEFCVSFRMRQVLLVMIKSISEAQHRVSPRPSLTSPQARCLDTPPSRTRLMTMYIASASL
jgi:hypothetical protein